MITQTYNIKYDKELGKGASGQVYEGVSKVSGEMVAVKIVFRRTLDNFKVKAIANEVGALRQLNHPNVVRLYDMFEDRHAYYFCLELIRGGELFDRIEKKTNYNEHEARLLCKQILSGIKHCHDHDIVHRDLKPDNLMMLSPDDDVSVKLVDFGFASETHGNDLTGIVGTPIYMAPEIWKQLPHGKPVDMWSFGVIAYILLCGYPPFADEKRDRLVRLISKANFAFHDEYWSGSSPEAKNFISSLLKVDVDERLTVDQALAHPWV